MNGASEKADRPAERPTGKDEEREAEAEAAGLPLISKGERESHNVVKE